jgi:NAD(P)-dependent dehydrogenase (short-subunit alcohol dehydrogenase family)
MPNPIDAPTDPAHLFRLDDRVAVVTGASSGLGDRFARVLHAAGARVVVAARRRDRLDALAVELGDRVMAVECDVVDDDANAALVDATIGEWGRIDVLVNNAGFGTPAPAEDEPMDHFRRTIDVNLTGLFSLTQLVARPMLAAGSGSIVNVASILGLVASSPIKEASYCAAKGAVVNLTRQLGVEWARKGVRVNAIAPGWFPTEMTNQMFEDGASIDFIRRQCPMGRPGATSELDGALLFLAGDASSYVTGHTLTVDGGWVAR